MILRMKGRLPRYRPAAWPSQPFRNERSLNRSAA